MYKLKFFLTLFIVNCSLLIVNAQHNETDTLNVANNGTFSDSTDLGNFELLAIEFPATLTSDTVFIQTKNIKTGTFKNVYYISATGVKIRAHIVVQASSIVFINRDMTFGLGRYARFVTDDAESGARILISHKGYIP